MSWAVYRVYDSDGSLLYIGCTSEPKYRMKHHRSTAPWRDSIAHLSVEWVDGFVAARIAEARAIRAESPRWNITHRHPRPDGSLRPDELWVQRMERLLSEGGERMPA